MAISSLKKSGGRNVWDKDRLGWLLLAWYDGFGSRTFLKLHRWFLGDGARAARAKADVFRGFGCPDSAIERFEDFRNRTEPCELAEKVDKLGIRFILSEDDEYPLLLRQISDPPLGLFVRGVTDLHDLDGVAIVGTRSNTQYGRHVARWLGTEISQSGLAIVSGLAGGIDTHAHESALDSGGRCVAVLGAGVDDDCIYPRSNLRLAGRILANDGTLISEFPPGTEARPFHFPLRNRIISGVCRATVVVEAAEKSGSLITAFQALEQNREVFSVPGPVTNAQSQGTNSLLTMGAIPCTSPQDVIRLLRGSSPPPPKPMGQLTEDERAILDLLETPRHVDEMARSLNVPVATLNARLMHLELGGWITSQGAHIYARTAHYSSTPD